ncbi:MAG: UDP-3-O-acyl-N-acetylglucosamine deacetylase [Planctomycetota bacterium]|nr:UDP-3-O-acyl-N-acetylglucosamine deacetylase [Planctomycetota bacterium]
MTVIASMANELSQCTLRRPASVKGVGLFSGRPVTATITPAPAGTGVAFLRTDLPGSQPIPARVEFVLDRPRRTALKRGDASVETVEHILSALAGMGVDNAIVEIDGPELPAGDGSASLFVDAIREAGIERQAEPRRALVVRDVVTVSEGDAVVMAMPANGSTELMYVLDYGPQSPLARQVHQFVVSPAEYAERIAPARTFSTEQDALAARQQGLFAHVGPGEFLVIGPSGPIQNSYRFDDEPVRHKLVDLLGDLALVGRPVHGRVMAVRSGHALNHKLARELLSRFGAAEPRLEPAPLAARDKSVVFDTRAILELLPHRYPMMLVDRVVELKEGKRAVGIKNVTYNEPYFQGHYPHAPIMPGVLVVEAMCQLAGLMLHGTLAHRGKIGVLLSLDGVKLRRAVTPGDQLVLEVEAIRASSRAGEARCRAHVDGKLAAEAHVRFLLVDPENAPA